jgi:hypothetical protein
MRTKLVVLLVLLVAWSANADKDDPSKIRFNDYSEVFNNRFDYYDVSIKTAPTRFIIDRKTGCEFMLTTDGGIQALTPLDACPKENIKPYK